MKNLVKPCLSILFFSVQFGFSQSYYDSQKQNNEYKRLESATQRAYAVPATSASTSAYKPSTSSASSGSTPNSKSTNYSSNKPFEWQGPVPEFLKSKKEKAAEKAVQDKADAAIKARADAAEKIRADIAAEESKKNAPMYEKMRNEKLERETLFKAPFIAKLTEAGFPKGNSDTENILSLSTYAETEKEAVLLIQKLVTAKKAFESQKNKASIDDLLHSISEYSSSWQTALKDLDFVEARFPQNKTKIDSSRLHCYAYYFGAEYPQSSTYKGEYFNYGKGTYDSNITKDFFTLADKYPEIAAKFMTLTTKEKNPFYIKLYEFTHGGTRDEIFKKCRTAEAQKYGMLALMSLPPFVAYKQEEYWTNVFAFENDASLIRKLTAEDWLKISVAQKASPMNVIKKVYFGNRELNVIPPKADNREDGDRVDSKAFDNSYNMFVAMQIVDKIASTGDAEALNTLGVATAMGMTYNKKGVQAIDCIGLFEEAAKKGSVWAQFNLVFASGFKLKKYKDSDKEKALNGFASFIKTADKAKLKEAIDILYRMGGRTYIKEKFWRNWDWYQSMPPELIGELVKTAATQGIVEAQYYLDQKYAW